MTARRLGLPAAALAGLLLAGCGPAYWEKSADREVAAVIAGKSGAALRPLASAPPGRIDDGARAETLVLTLRDTLVLAARSNRDYRGRKEDVYLSALDLTYQRFLFSPRATLDGSLGYSDNGDRNLAGSLNLNLVQWLAAGAQITADLTLDFLKYLTGSKQKTYQSFLDLDLLQPLFRGAGRKIARENLVQSERDTVYAIRAFLRYQRGFSVDVAERYFNILLAADNVESYRTNYRFLQETTARVIMLAESGRLQPFQADQARQNELAANEQWIRAMNDYAGRLDDFAVFLGVAAGTPLALDPSILSTFLARGVEPPDPATRSAVRFALERRLDLMTAFDKTADAERRLAVARDQLRPRLDLSAGLGTSSEARSTPSVPSDDTSVSAGLGYSLPINRVPDRNAYRRKQIELDRSRRQFALDRHEAEAEVRDLLRSLDEAYQTYVNQKSSLELATRRVDGTDMLLQAGRATTRDLLESQESLLNSKLALSRSVVNYLISYLRLLQSAEMLELDDRGVWKGDLYGKISGENR